MEFHNPFPGVCSFQYEPINSNNALLHPSEIKMAEQFKAINRQNEFKSGRRCARIALETIGFPKLPVLRNQNRSPAWPFSVIGSITHGAGFAAAIVSRPRSGIIGIGLDIEDLSREIKTNITKHVLTPREIEIWLDGKTEVSREVRIIFSIKEAIYKCMFPLAGVILGFHDAEIDEITKQGFRGRLLKSPLKQKTPLPFHGRLMVSELIVLSAIKTVASDFEP